MLAVAQVRKQAVFWLVVLAEADQVLPLALLEARLLMEQQTQVAAPEVPAIIVSPGRSEEVMVARAWLLFAIASLPR